MISLSFFSQETRSKSAPQILQGQETEVVQPHDLGQLAQESAHEANRALGELKESTSILLHKLGEAVGLFRLTFPVRGNKNTPAQAENDMQRRQGIDDIAGLDVAKAQHHGDLVHGKRVV
jgi:hypothetical protein